MKIALRLCRASIAGAVLVVVTACGPDETADNDRFSLVNEEINDVPVKTQIAQHVAAQGVPTKSELETEILKRFRAARKRSGFRYHDSPTNIYIYVYGSKEQARAEQGLWIAMLAKNYDDAGEPRLCRILQRSHARRALEREPVLRPRPRPQCNRRMAGRLQHREASFLARLPDPGGIRRGHHRNRLRRCADGRLCASAGCSTRAKRRNRNGQGSNRRWMNVQWQVRSILPQGREGRGQSPPLSRCQSGRPVAKARRQENAVTAIAATALGAPLAGRWNACRSSHPIRYPEHLWPHHWHSEHHNNLD